MEDLGGGNGTCRVFFIKIYPTKKIYYQKEKVYKKWNLTTILIHKYDSFELNIWI